LSFELPPALLCVCELKTHNSKLGLLNNELWLRPRAAAGGVSLTRTERLQGAKIVRIPSGHWRSFFVCFARFVVGEPVHGSMDP
jgi:hypothetical protein